MPLGGPPPGQGRWPDPITFTSEIGIDVTGPPARKTHETLRQIDQVLMNKATRWETLKRFRVMRLGRLPRMDRDNGLRFLPKAYAPFYLNPTVSNVLLAAEVGNVKQIPEHLDLDWFGTADENWWPGRIGGQDFEDLVAEQAQRLLENSFGLPNSGSANHSDWTWPAPNDPAQQGWTFGDHLSFQAPPGGPGRPAGLIITWEVSSAAPLQPSCWIDPAEPTHLQIRTRFPTEDLGIKLP